MAEFDNISFKNANAIFGVLEIQGFADGDDVISIEFDTEQFTKLVGAKGDVARSQTADNSCTVTIKLLPTSSSNAELTALYLADVESGIGVLPMIVNDKELGETFVINNAWIQKYPAVARGQNPTSRDWIFQGDFLTPVPA